MDGLSTVLYTERSRPLLIGLIRPRGTNQVIAGGQRTKYKCENRNINHIIEFAGEKLCVSEWAERIGITHTTLSKRLQPDGLLSVP